MKNQQKKEKTSFQIFFGLSSFQMLAMFRRGLFYAFLSIYLKLYLGLSVMQTSLFATLPMIFNVMFQNFIWGPLSDKKQRRRTFVVTGEFLAGIGTLIVWYIHFITENLLTAGFIIIWGLSCIEIFWSMSNIGWSALVSDLYPSEERSKIQGRMTGIGGIGRIIGVFIGGLIYDGLSTQYEGWGFREGGLFFIASFVMFISIIPMMFVPEGGTKRNNGEPVPESLLEKNKPLEEKNMNGKILKIFLIFIVALIFVNFGINSIATIFSQYLFLEAGFNVSSQTLSHISITYSIASIIIGLNIGRITKLTGYGENILLGTLVSVCGMLIFVFTNNLILIYIGNFLMGAAYVIISASTYAYVSELIPLKQRARLFAVYNATFFLSWGIAGTIISGPIIDFLGSTKPLSYQIAILIGALIALIGFIIFTGLLFWRKKLPKK
ncbi:MAG: MFS transporter [Promethearchaeota archaeon]